MTMSKGAIGNLINRYRAVLKKCRLINAFGSLAVAGMLIMGGVGGAGATSLINGEHLFHGDTPVTATESVGGGVAGIVANSGNMSITVDGEKKLTVTGNSGSVSVYGAYIDAGATLGLNGNTKFSLSSANQQITGVYAKGNTTMNGDITIVAKGGSQEVRGVDPSNGADLIFKGEQTFIEATSTGGRIIGVQNSYDNSGSKSTIDFNAKNTSIHVANNPEAANLTEAIRAYQSTTNFTGNVDIQVIGGKEDTYAVHGLGESNNAFTTEINFSGDVTTIDARGSTDVYAVISSGVPVSINFTGKSVDIETTSTEGGTVGLRSQYAAHLYATADVSVTATGKGSAYGVMVADYSNYAGNADFEGSLTVVSSAPDNAYGVYNSATPANVTVGKDENGYLIVKGTTQVTSSADQGYAVGLFSEGNYAKTQVTGDITIDASSKGGDSHGVLAKENTRVTLGSEGKNISVASASSGGISKAVEASGGSEITFAGAQTTIRDTSTTTQKNYGVYVDNAEVTFGADSTAIEVRGVGSADMRGYGVDLWNGASLSFTGNDVSISDYQQAYTAQTVTVRDSSTIDFANSGNVDIKAESPYGASAVVVQSDEAAGAVFNNNGNVTITSSVEDPAQFAGTNVIGVLVEKGTASFTEKVGKLNIVINGQGCDDDGTDDSHGTAAIFVQDPKARVEVKAKELNIAVSAAVDPNFTPADQKKYDDAYGIRASAGTVSVGKATKTSINVNESRGTAYGVASMGADSAIEILGDASITTVGETNAYGLYADKSGSILFGSEGTNGKLTSSGTGIFVGTGSSIDLNGTTAITAAKLFEGAGTITNAGALTLTGSAADFTGEFSQSSGSTALSGAFFGGEVKLNGGTMNVEAAAPAAAKTVSVVGKGTVLNAKSLDLSKGNVNVSSAGSVVVAEGGTTTFGSGTLTINGGSVTADADNFISDAYAAVADAAAGVVGAAGDLYLRLAPGTEYTATQYNNAKTGLFDKNAGEGALLTFLNGTLKMESGEQVVIGGTEQNGNATLNGVTPVVTKDNEAAQHAGMTVPSVPDRFVPVVQGNDAAKNLLSVSTLEVNGSTFSAKGLQVNPRDAAQGVALNIGGGSRLTLIGGETPGGSVIIDENGQTVQTSVSLSGGASLALGMEANSGRQMVRLAGVAVQDGTLNVNGNGPGTTQHAYDALTLSDDAARVNLNNAAVSAGEATLNKGALSVRGSAAHIGTLNADGGTIFVDPSYMKIDTLAPGSFGSALLVSHGSVVEIGSVAELQAKAAGAGLNPAATASGQGFTLASARSMLALGKAVRLGTGGKIVVDARVDDQGRIDGSPVPDAAYFGGGSLLVVDSAIATGGGAAITAPSASDTITVREGAKLYITDATAGTTYTVASGFADASSTVAGWTGGDLIANRLLHAERVAGADGSVTVTTSVNKAAGLYANVSVPHTLEAMMEAARNNVNSAHAGIAFLSRALEPGFLAEGDVVPAIDSAAQLAYAGGVQASTIAAARAPARAIQNHLSLAGNVARPGAGLHKDGFDLWAQALYGANRARGFSAGSLDAGYNSDFAGAVIGGDRTFGAGAGKARVGLAFSVGAGETRSRGDFNSTRNDFDFWGVSLYGGSHLGNLNVIADLGYSASTNDLRQDIPSSLGLGGRIRGEADSSVVTAGIRGEYRIRTGILDVMPHAGVRSMAVRTDSFATKLEQGGKLFETDSHLQHIWQFPVGVSLSTSITTESGWKVKPQADFSVVPAVGDTKYVMDVRTPGVNASDSIKRRVLDGTSFDGVFGVEVGKDNVSFGLNYNVQASGHHTGQGVTASFLYKF